MFPRFFLRNISFLVAVFLALPGSAWALTAECIENPVIVGNSQSCAACLVPEDVLVTDGICASAELYCPEPGVLTPTEWICTSPDGTESATLSCTVEVADIGKPLLECSGLDLACGATDLGPLPAEGIALCGQPTTTDCFVCTGTECEPGSAGLAPWDDFVPDSSGPWQYVCSATVLSRDPLPGLPAPENTNSCTNFIQAASGEQILSIEVESPPPLWPPDHEMEIHSVSEECIAGALLIDSCTSETVSLPIPALAIQITHITSSEPDNSSGSQSFAGDGDTSCDIGIESNSLVRMRRERSGQGRGEGRTYNVYYTASYTDSSGHTASAPSVCRFQVPHNTGQDSPPTGMCESCTGPGCFVFGTCPELPGECK